MPSPLQEPSLRKESSSRPVAIWVMTGVIMLLVQVVLGGITRLSGSGLSITEWNVVTGALPPLGHAQWLEAFNKYRQTPQFRLVNSGFGLADFKFIFFWEWFHRLWARMVGLVFAVGFVYLLWKKNMRAWMIRPLLILFLLGALQGAVGWIMVASGLVGDAIYVAPAKLALHFVFALVLVVYTFWFGLQLTVPVKETVRSRSLHTWTVVILVVLFFQLLFGALMAGNKAAAAAPTWPMINGDWVPAAVSGQHAEAGERMAPGGRTAPDDLTVLQEFAGNKILIQFIHRGLAYLLLALVLAWTAKAYRLRAITGYLRKIRGLPLSLLALQIALGICTLLASPGIVPNRWLAFDWLAQIHQVVGLLFLLTMTGMLYLVKPVRHSGTV